MRKLSWIVGLLAFSFAGLRGEAEVFGLKGELERVNSQLSGQVLDFTHNHGVDHRIFSSALGEKRDMYVYLPPHYDPHKKYPLALFLHGATQDEQFFLKSVVGQFDRSIGNGTVPPCIVAAPDGSLRGRPSFFKIASFYANTDAGRYEDYLMGDVWNFLMETFPIYPEREAHILFGVSMGGSAAFSQAIKHQDKVKIAIGFMPVVNIRWVDCQGRYWAPFDPNCWGWRTELCPLEVVGRPHDLVKIRFHNLFGPLIGYGPDATAKMSLFNPIELVDQYHLKKGDLDLYIGYGGQDEFNVTAQVDSFLYRAKERDIDVGVEFDPQGHHDLESGRRLFPAALRWIAPLIAKYGAKS